jgi:hypothetical protein
MIMKKIEMQNGIASRRSPIRHRVLLLLASFASFAGATTTVHNNGFTINNRNLPDSPNYASNVAEPGANWDIAVGATGVLGTPSIQLVWDGEGGGNATPKTGVETYINWNGRGNVVQLDGSGTEGTPNTFISFVPQNAAVGVAILSFDLDAWSGWPAAEGDPMTVEWSIRDSTKTGTVLASGVWNKGRTTGGRDTISPNFNGNPGQTLVLQFTRTSGKGDYLALDNLVFDQISTGPIIVSFTSEIDTIDGLPFMLAWRVTNPTDITSLTISDGSNVTDVLPLTDTVDGTGTLEVDPNANANATYTLTLDGAETSELLIYAGKAVSLTSSARVAVAPAYQVTLAWQVEAATLSAVTISDGTTVHDVTSQTASDGSGTATFTVPLATTVFVLDVNQSGRTQSWQVLRQQENSDDFSLGSATAPVGSPATITWTNAAGGSSDWIGIYPLGVLPGGQASTRWNYLNGTKTAGGSFPAGSMSFSDLPAGDYYAVLLLNDGFTIAKGPLVFSVIEPPAEPENIRMVSVSRVGNEFALEWESQAGRVYDIYASPDLLGDPLLDWTKIGENYPAEGDGTTRFTEDLGASPPPRRFYKVYESNTP